MPTCPTPASPSAPPSAAPAAGSSPAATSRTRPTRRASAPRPRAIGVMVAAGEREIVEVAVVAGGEALCSPAAAAASGWPSSGARDRRPSWRRRTGSAPRPDAWASCCRMAFGAGNLAAPATCRPMPRRSFANVPAAAPLLGFVLGSGLGGIADRVVDPIVIDYGDLPGFPRPSVQGHAGRLVLGTTCRRAGRLPRRPRPPLRGRRRRTLEHAGAHAAGDRLPCSAAHQCRLARCGRSRARARWC